MMLIDTCILIDYSRRKQDIVNFIESTGKPNLFINSIIQMEMIQGALNKRELLYIKKDLQGFSSLPIEQPVLDLAFDLLNQYALSHQAKIPDMIIAATALTYGLELKTYNLKDFLFINTLNVSTLNII